MRKPRWTAIVALLATVACSAAQPEPSSGPILWKSAPPAAPAGLEALERRASGHLVVQFEEIPNAEKRAQLAAEGLELQRYLGSNAYFARVRTGASTAVARDGGVVAAAELEVAWKLHPLLKEAVLPEHAHFHWPARGGALLADGESDEEVEAVAVYVLFHPDVELEPAGRELIEAHGGLFRNAIRSINGAVAWIPASAIEALAAEDAVQWVEPPLPALSTVNDSNRALTQVNTVQAAPYGLSGAGVTVMVYDAGYATPSHPDFGGRLFVRGASEMSDHATHVSGTVGGSGASSGGQFRGMAPGVTIQSYEFEVAGGLQQGFLYTNPGDLENDYDEAINVYGAEVANNSIGTNTAPNGFPCSWEGDYGVTDMLIDAIVGGSLGSPMRIVWANGNERNSGRCGTTYHTTAPPACAKNHISVGAVNSNNDTMTGFSSWGPADDGRLKPDISAPGCQSNGDGGVTSLAPFSGYDTFCGTSMASPTVCGMAALLLEDFKQQYPSEPLPRNSTLKVLLAHTAVDLGNPGPDYQFGYGSVRAPAAVDLLRSGSFREDVVEQGEERNFYVPVLPGTGALKVTMAWDDPPGAINTIPELVNDLDLVLVAPNGASTYLPWTLNPASPSSPAVRTAPDRVNNIEQVVVDNPIAGTWTVVVRGFAVPQGPQVFSIAATPTLQICSSAGMLLLDEDAYACTSTVQVRVIDCDLDTDISVVDVATVGIASTLDPVGVEVVLVETAPGSATFVGTIGLTETGTPGRLLVAHGATITATYADADQGTGNPAAVVDTASVDCVSPAISGISMNQAGLSVGVSFQTDEVACGAVEWGTSCGAATGRSDGACGQTEHFIALGLPLTSTTYYLWVSAEDPQGNVAVADNAGSCYAVTTPDLLFADSFDVAELNRINWPAITGLPTVDEMGIDPPSGPYALRLNGDPSGGEIVMSPVLNLSASCGAELHYWYQRAGQGDLPEASENLFVEYVGASGNWAELDRQLGAGPAMTSFEQRVLVLPTAAYHENFRFRFRNNASIGANDDWFVDEEKLIPPADVDCNSNGVRDACDILTKTSGDCQQDGIPDECQLDGADCNANALPDGCEVDGGPTTGFALAFDGVNDYAYVPSTAALRPANNFTIEAWVNHQPTGSPQVLVMHDENGGDDDGYRLLITPAGHVRFAVYNQHPASGQFVESAAPLEAGKWHHVAAVYEQSVLRLYVDGEVTSREAQGDVRYSVLTSFNLGRRGGTSKPNTDFLKGLLDEIRVWNVVRSPAQIEAARFVSLSGTEDGLVALWRADEGTGAALRDATGRHLGLLVNGTSWWRTGPDCNTNGVPDSCELAVGVAFDCDANGRLDECEPEKDCNANGVVDACDVAAGTSGDCDSNGVPDECQADFDEDGEPDACDKDVDGDGVLNESDLCAWSKLGTPGNVHGGPLGDVDGDCAVTLADYATFADCLAGTGPGGAHPLPLCGETCDADRDGDTDLLDFGVLQRTFLSAGR